MIHSRIGEVTERIQRRSRDSRARYRERIARAADAVAGTLRARVDPDEWDSREAKTAELSANGYNTGRELITAFQAVAGCAKAGAGVIFGGRA